MEALSMTMSDSAWNTDVFKNQFVFYNQRPRRTVEYSAVDAMFGIEVPKLTEIGCIFAYTYFLHSDLPLVSIRDSILSEVGLCSHPMWLRLSYD